MYSPSAGDKGLCAPCSRLLPSEPPWRSDGRSVDQALDALEERGGGSRLGRMFQGRNLRRIAIGAGGALLVAGLGIWVAVRRDTVSGAWNAIRSHRWGAGFATLRRAPDAPQIDQSGSVANAPPVRWSRWQSTRSAVDRETGAAKALRRAQLQVEAGKTKAAEKTLKPLLKKELPRNDRALALRLMGAAEARRGHRRAAVAWYRKSMKVTDDAAEREHVARRIEQLTHARNKADLRAAGDTP